MLKHEASSNEVAGADEAREERRRKQLTARKGGSRRTRGRRKLEDNLDSLHDAAESTADDLDAVGRALSTASSEAIRGAATVAQNLALDLFDAGQRAGGDDDDEDIDDEDVDERPRRRRRRVSSWIADLSSSFSEAMADAAGVLARSSRRFQDEYDALQDDRSDRPPPRPRATTQRRRRAEAPSETPEGTGGA